MKTRFFFLVVTLTIAALSGCAVSVEPPASFGPRDSFFKA